MKQKDERLELYEQENNWLREQLLQLKREKFGPKSERWQSQEQLVFNEAEMLAKQEKPDAAKEDPIEVKAHTKKRGKRKPLPKDLPREIVVIELPEDQRIGEDGKPLKPIGKEISEKLHYEPAQLKVIEYHRIRYGVDSGDTGVVAPPVPSIIPKGYVTSGLLAGIVVKKYGYGLPFYRQEEMFEKMGIEIPRCTQARWVVEAAEQCRPIWNILQDWLLESFYVSCDETWTQVLNEQGRKPEAKSWMWVRCTPGDERKIILFDYDPARSGEVAKKLFAEYRGILQVDGFSSYNGLEKQDGVIRIGCNMHGRRKFESAFKIGSKSGRPLAEEALKFYKILYEIEKQARGKPPAERHLIRQEQAVPVWDEFKQWAEVHQRKVPPKSKIGEAYHYFLNEYEYLTGYLRDGRLEMDNGFAERAIKLFAIGRKNWLFSDSVAGADASALFYSFIVTAKINGNDPSQVLKTIFDEIPRAKSLEDFEKLATLIVSRPDAH
ncbi:MAG: IS66 family transposase [Pseudobdellovibrionaceae bacterium]